jgi:hypothetical protein
LAVRRAAGPPSPGPASRLAEPLFAMTETVSAAHPVTMAVRPGFCVLDRIVQPGEPRVRLPFGAAENVARLGGAYTGGAP